MKLGNSEQSAIILFLVLVILGSWGIIAILIITK